MKGGENRNMRKLQRAVTYARQGFTLIELLVVVGIIAVLAIAALIAINPLEAQRKTRDAQRLKDLSTLQTILVQYIDDFGVAGEYSVTSAAVGASNNCGTGWLSGTAGTRKYCNYINVIPMDPSNGKTVGFINSTGARQAGAVAGYRVNVANTGEYGISARLESVSNASKLNADGVSDLCVSAYSATTAVVCP